ncbi:NUDIX hydrolase [Nitrospina watsonii]|uniref:Hydrolase, NUDIX family n=1 Tax=Nitrospina watsonii TaxID=1323948 RepID=A0ABN8W3I8_9BACT|nr:CoA pyrophosphatase [Nitrospina watsonii]CAI2719671.1 Hydrolase, NUDIX family [Nitrospina watsonii]
MDLDAICQRLRVACPVRRDAVTPQPGVAAVLVILYPHNGVPHVLMMKRSKALRSHPGEIGFPGGLFEDGDGDLLTTALRETEEELDLAIFSEDVIARLPPVETLSGIEVTPFVSLQTTLADCTPNPEEVEEVLQPPLIALWNSYRPEAVVEPPSDFAYWYGPHRIWGATARILRHLSEVATAK